jgi:hypothetical protein
LRQRSGDGRRRPRGRRGALVEVCRVEAKLDIELDLAGRLDGGGNRLLGGLVTDHDGPRRHGEAEAAVGGTVVRAELDRRKADDLRSSAVSTSEEQALALMTITSENVDERMDQLTKSTTGDFQRQLEGIRRTFVDVVHKGEVASTGEVRASAIREIDDTSALVLLALDTQVTNSETEQPKDVPYRIIVQLSWKEDRWLVSGMQFVQ